MKAMSDCEEKWIKHEFWIAAHNNFLVTGILEWCKLFTESSGKHHWNNSVSEQADFESSLLRAVHQTESEFTACKDNLRLYRNRFLAHLDEDNTYRLPRLSAAEAGTKHLLQWPLDRENDCDAFPDAPVDAESFYVMCLEHASKLINSDA